MLLYGADMWREYRQKGLPPTPVLRGANIEVGAGQMVAVVGPSGAGKSTLLHSLGLVEPLDRGEVYWDGQPVHRWPEARKTRLRGREMGFVFQFFNLIPTLSVFDNVRLVLRFGDIPRRQWHDRALEVLKLVGMDSARRLRPHQLSAGQQQRVAIARALANRPRILFADEPTGNLDSAMAGDIVNSLLELVSAHGLSLVMVTHNPELASRAHRIYRMRDGELAEIGVLPTWDAIVDPLTKVYNRRGMDIAAEKFEALGTPCAILLFDLDHFKSINDRFGHKVGDVVLREMAARLSTFLRKEDGLARYGGEEFAVLMKGADLAAAAIRADELRLRVAEKPILADGHLVSITASVGVSAFEPGRNTWSEAVKAADRRLYLAKDSGRNRVVYTDPSVGALL